jgi:flagellar motor switch protein FliG
MNSKNKDHIQNEPQAPQNGPLETGVKIDGLQQVIELLKYADPAFRESLLKRLTHRDPQLAKSLRKMIK